MAIKTGQQHVFLLVSLSLSPISFGHTYYYHGHAHVFTLVVIIFFFFRNVYCTWVVLYGNVDNNKGAQMYVCALHEPY